MRDNLVCAGDERPGRERESRGDSHGPLQGRRSSLSRIRTSERHAEYLLGFGQDFCSEILITDLECAGEVSGQAVRNGDVRIDPVQRTRALELPIETQFAQLGFLTLLPTTDGSSPRERRKTRPVLSRPETLGHRHRSSRHNAEGDRNFARNCLTLRSS
jgi:hypothetical protein